MDAERDWEITVGEKTDELIRLRAEIEKLKRGATHDPACTVYGRGPCTCDFSLLREHNAELERENKTLRKQIAEQGWQPIESAPKDGSRIILAYVGGGDVWLGFWDDGKDNYWKRAGWYDAEDAVNILTAKPCPATHWRPLPAPPKDAAMEKAE